MITHFLIIKVNHTILSNFCIFINMNKVLLVFISFLFASCLSIEEQVVQDSLESYQMAIGAIIFVWLGRWNPMGRFTRGISCRSNRAYAIGRCWRNISTPRFGRFARTEWAVSRECSNPFYARSKDAFHDTAHSQSFVWHDAKRPWYWNSRRWPHGPNHSCKTLHWGRSTLLRKHILDT